VIYEIRHITRYRYESLVASSTGTLRLLPRELPGQIVYRAGIDIAPIPAERSERPDVFGNRVTRLRIEQPHRMLTITATSRVQVERPLPPAPALTPAWEEIRRDAVASSGLDGVSPALMLFPSRLVPLNPDVTAYAAESFKHGCSSLEAAFDLARRIRGDFTYKPESTEISTPLEEAFRKRRGVCQDFSHIMISGLRGLGLPAAYVSGYIRTIPPPGKPRLAGADASHAWVSVWCGPAFGWIDLDPTNGVFVGDDHIVVAIGRDYYDVSPVEGVLVASIAGKQNMTYGVDVIPQAA
jgi:transglutaminase-like putative cysteine protease